MQPLVWIFWTNTQETQGPLHRPFAKQIGKFKASPFWATFDCACANPLYVNFRLRLQHDILTQRTQGRITHSAIYAMAYPRGHLLNFSYHITFYNYGSIRVWRRIRLFYHIAPVLKKAPDNFYKMGPKSMATRVSETRAPAKFYVTLWLQFVVWRHSKIKNFLQFSDSNPLQSLQDSHSDAGLPITELINNFFVGISADLPELDINMLSDLADDYNTDFVIDPDSVLCHL